MILRRDADGSKSKRQFAIAMTLQLKTNEEIMSSGHALNKVKTR